MSNVIEQLQEAVRMLKWVHNAGIADVSLEVFAALEGVMDERAALEALAGEMELTDKNVDYAGRDE